jgi:hypothetical protein
MYWLDNEERNNEKCKLRRWYHMFIELYTVHRSRVDPRSMVARGEVMFFSSQRENICPSNKEMNRAVTMLKLPNVCS